jgi:hypothetical protein
MMRIFVLTLLIATHVSIAWASITCPAPNVDENGYLNKICEHLVANKIDVSPGHPARYKIKSVREFKHKGKRVIEVRLDCCYMGDSAILDEESGKVISFRPGPK